MKLFYLLFFIFLSSCITTSELAKSKQRNSNLRGSEESGARGTYSGANTTDSESISVQSPQIHIFSENISSDASSDVIRENSLPTSTFDFFVPTENKKTIKQISLEKHPVNFKNIGAILPLTGKNSAAGQRALSALRLGLGITETNPLLSLFIYDSQSDALLAANGVQKLLKENQVIAIFGGLGAKEATAVSEKARFFEVPFFTFSQKVGLTDETDFTFRNAVTAEMQIDKLLDFSFDKLSAKRFAILYPNDNYGVEFANSFWDQVLARGGSIATAQSYEPKNPDFTTQVQKMVGLYYADDRKEEFKEKQKILAERKDKKTTETMKKNSRENSMQENILDPIVDFDAVFIPDGGRALGQALAFFKANSALNTAFLGTNLWNTPDLIRRTGSHAQRIYFVDTSSAVSENSRTEFYQKYFSLNQEEPELLEAQVYESAKIIKEQIISGVTNREDLASNLRSLGRRPGAYDEIRMSNSKEIERPLSILTIDQGLIKKY